MKEVLYSLKEGQLQGSINTHLHQFYFIQLFLLSLLTLLSADRSDEQV